MGRCFLPCAGQDVSPVTHKCVTGVTGLVAGVEEASGTPFIAFTTVAGSLRVKLRSLAPLGGLRHGETHPVTEQMEALVSGARAAEAASGSGVSCPFTVLLLCAKEDGERKSRCNLTCLEACVYLTRPEMCLGRTAPAFCVAASFLMKSVCVLQTARALTACQRLGALRGPGPPGGAKHRPARVTNVVQSRYSR